MQEHLRPFTVLFYFGQRESDGRQIRPANTLVRSHTRACSGTAGKKVGNWLHFATIFVLFFWAL